MTEVEADRRTKEALRTARAQAGDNKSATVSELVRMMRNDELLLEAFTVLGIRHLKDSQNPRH